MNRTPDDAIRLMNLLVAICGDQINGYRPKIEALVATLNANARFVKTRQDGGQKERRMSRWSHFYVGGRRSAGADRSEAQLPAAHRTRKAVEAVGKRNGPSDFCPGWAVFHQFEITKNSEPSNSAASSSAAHTTEIESYRLSLLWIMNPAPQPAAAFTPGTRFCP